ncbi:hypothetical protein F9K79_19770 [Ochrobactrum sp. Kaboul]|nr:hypothetical protein F9K79_19770 [Ochrobactrum sp. Kaboul]
MIKNRKNFFAPPKDGSDFKELFRQIVATGAGRELDEEGLPAGSWTPELLAQAISKIDSNHIGVDLRTVQLWFQENDKGISASNIRWLARIAGCGDPVATSEWQLELRAAQARLLAKRQERKKASDGKTTMASDADPVLSPETDITPVIALTDDVTTQSKKRRFSLAAKSEALFSRGSSLNLAASVFAGFTALGFLSYIFGIHNVTYTRADGAGKQVGFLWTANWTLVFMVFFPLFFAFVAELVTYWKNDGRAKIRLQQDETDGSDTWDHIVQTSSLTYWAVCLICILFAGVFQWIGVCLIPLLSGDDKYAVDWGTVGLIRPELISIPEEIIFTGFAYLYMSVCFYLFFAGLILLYSVVHDLWRMSQTSDSERRVDFQHELNAVSLVVMGWIFRCTILGILVAIVMKVQSNYLVSRGENVVAWLMHDLTTALYGRADAGGRFHYRMPTQYSSLLVAISSCFVFAYGLVRLRGVRITVPCIIISLLVISYVLIDAFSGFSILLSIAVFLAIFGLISPGFGKRAANQLGRI